jgi:uncharacterized protein (DUF58 family)
VAPEYVGNRPFLPGDPPRRIDVRAWARLSVPATKQYGEASDTATVLILDTRARRIPSRDPDGQVPALEAAISLCASVAYSIQMDSRIDTLLAGTERHAFLELSHETQVDRVHDVLAGLEASEDYDAEQVGPLLEDRLGEASEVVFILLGWDATYKPLVALAEQAGCATRVVVVGESGGEPDAADDDAWWRNVRFVAPEAVATGEVESL